MPKPRMFGSEIEDAQIQDSTPLKWHDTGSRGVSRREAAQVMYSTKSNRYIQFGPIGFTIGHGRMVPSVAAVRLVCVLLLLVIGDVANRCRAADFLEGFDSPKISWLVSADAGLCKVVDHRRQAQLRRSGTAAEQLILDAKAITRIELSHRLSPARALDELTASVWVRSNRTGAKLALRLVFPHLVDPQTGKKTIRWIEGESYTADNTWQSLTCRTTQKELQRRMQLLRATLGSDIDLRDVYVDRAMVQMELGEGTTELCFDELKLGPVVSPSSETPLMPEETPQPSNLPDIKMQHDRLYLNGQPFFITFFPDHNEQVSDVANLGFKLAWVPQYQDLERLQAFRKLGIGCIATPPVATSPAGEVLDADNAGLAPFGEEFDPVWFWMLGNGLGNNDRTRIASWQKQMLSADRRRQRPLMVGVTGAERSFSRVSSMLGTSRSVQQTGLNYLAYRNWLGDRQLAARRGIFRWTWIDVEPSRELIASRQERGLAVPVIEPDQLKQQVYAALCSGVQGLGFWTTDGLFRDEIGAAETRLMLKQLHLELRLLEPWLATGSVRGHARFEIAPPEPFQPIAVEKKRGVTPVGYLVSKSKNPASPIAGVSNSSPSTTIPHVEATLIESDFGTLLLGMWYDPRAQFVSGQMAARNVRIVVPGIKETAKAWEITTTEIRPLKTDRNARPGGTMIHLDQFDMTTAIIISSDLTLGDKLRAQVAQMQAQSASLLVQLAQEKLRRVEVVIQEISQLGHAQADDGRMLAKARNSVAQAVQDLERKDFIKAREQADLSLRMLRVLQRAHWDAAQESLAKMFLPRQSGEPSGLGIKDHPEFSPLGSRNLDNTSFTARLTPQAAQQIAAPQLDLRMQLLNAHLSSPHTICFQTLPDHWGLLNEMQTNWLPSFSERESGILPSAQGTSLNGAGELLRFGDFEQDAAFRTAGWQHLQSTIPNVVATAELVQAPDRRGYCLRMAAAPASDKGVPSLISAAPVTFVTPKIATPAGQVLRIHGWVKILRPLTGSRDGFELCDSIGGTESALHWNEVTPEWTRFEMLREPDETQSITLSFVLHGLGEVLIDDVKIEPIKMRPIK